MLAPTVVVGGRIGSFVNSRLSGSTAVRAMMVAYVLVGLFVLVRISLPGSPGH